MFNPQPKSGKTPKKAKKPLKRTAIKKKYVKINNTRHSKAPRELGNSEHENTKLVRKKQTTKRKKSTGEAKIFKEIWEERDPWCEWCGKGILEFNVANYHHVIEKSKSLELRLDKNNIVKICFDCHFNAHNK
jgi:hypothetical protein